MNSKWRWFVSKIYLVLTFQSQQNLCAFSIRRKNFCLWMRTVANLKCNVGIGHPMRCALHIQRRFKRFGPREWDSWSIQSWHRRVGFSLLGVDKTRSCRVKEWWEAGCLTMDWCFCSFKTEVLSLMVSLRVYLIHVVRICWCRSSFYYRTVWVPITWHLFMEEFV